MINAISTNTPWYVETLPLHPQPARLESCTSFLMRLAVANCIQTFPCLAPLCLPLHIHNRLVDYPVPSFGMLPTITACPESRLQATTFFHLFSKFGRGATQFRFVSKHIADHSIALLHARGEALTQRAVRKLVQLSPARLMRYPQAWELLTSTVAQAKTEEREHRNAALFEQVLQGIEHLKGLQQPITQCAISNTIEIPPSSLRSRPHILRALQQHSQHHHSFVIDRWFS